MQTKEFLNCEKGLLRSRRSVQEQEQTCQSEQVKNGHLHSLPTKSNILNQRHKFIIN